MKHSLEEIGYADKLGELSVPDSDIIAFSKEDGTISQRPVLKYEQGDTTLFFFANGDKITALVLVSDGNKLRAIKNFSGHSGQVYALVNYVVNIKNNKLIIASDEPLTDEGFQWVSRMIKTPTGIKISDIDGNPINLDILRREWVNSKLSRGTESGGTSIVLGEISTEWRAKLQENENRLIPYVYFDTTDEPSNSPSGDLNIRNRHWAGQRK